MLTDDPAVLVARANSSKTMDSELGVLGVLVPICNGILHEFRNHLTLLSAATTEVKAVTSSPSIVPEISQALMETESNVRRMTALMAFMDAAVQGGPPATVELDGVIERALRLVAPALGRVAVSFNKPSHIQVRNEGTALECLRTLPKLSKNFYYALPNKIFEYLASGLPVLAADYPEARKIILQNGVGLCFDPYDPKSIAAQLNRMVHERSLLVKMRETIPGVLVKIDADREWEKIVSIYDRF